MLLAIVSLSTPCKKSTPPVCKNTVALGSNEPPLSKNVVSWFSVSAVVAPPTAVLSVFWPVRVVSWFARSVFVLFQLAPAKMLPVNTLPVLVPVVVVVVGSEAIPLVFAVCVLPVLDAARLVR